MKSLGNSNYELNHENVENDFNSFRGKKVKLGLVFPPKTEGNSPRDPNQSNSKRPALVS